MFSKSGALCEKGIGEVGSEEVIRGKVEEFNELGDGDG